MGYHQAGFDVVGVDINPQPRYPFAFIQHDALTLDVRFMAMFDAIHASPPCQGYTELRHAPGTRGAPKLITKVRERLIATGRPWVIENVEDARSDMREPVLLCGTMFGLTAEGAQLQRHRLFETSFPICQPDCEHDADRPVVGVYGGHARIRSARFGGRTTRDRWPNGHRPVAAEAMGMDWATLAEMSEAIPPAYTRLVGESLMVTIYQRRAA